MIVTICGHGENIERCGYCSEIARLKSAIEDLTRELGDRVAYCEMVVSERDDLRAEVEALRKALKIYGRHHAPCQFHTLTNYKCTCGFDAALAAKDRKE